MKAIREYLYLIFVYPFVYFFGQKQVEKKKDDNFSYVLAKAVKTKNPKGEDYNLFDYVPMTLQAKIIMVLNEDRMSNEQKSVYIKYLKEKYET